MSLQLSRNTGQKMTHCANQLQIHAYVGLLSATETYGLSAYAVIVTQVVVENKRFTSR